MWRAVVADARALNVLDLQIFCEFIVLMMGHNDFKFLTLNFVRSVSNIPSVIARSLPLQPVSEGAERRCVNHCKGLYVVALIDR